VPLYTADALVLRTYKLSEADRIVVFLTRDRGKKRGVAKGARRPRSRFTGALEPLTEVRVAYFEKERRELVGLNYAETHRSPLVLGSPDALGYVSYFAELLDEWAQEADADDRLYRLGASMLDALAAALAIAGRVSGVEGDAVRRSDGLPGWIAYGAAAPGRQRAGRCAGVAGAGERASDVDCDASGEDVEIGPSASRSSPSRLAESE
jgi:hypothetical protein